MTTYIGELFSFVFCTSYPRVAVTPKSLPISSLFCQNTPEYPRLHRKAAKALSLAVLSKNVPKYARNENSPRSWRSFSAILVEISGNQGQYSGFYSHGKSGRFTGFSGDRIRESEADTGPESPESLSEKYQYAKVCREGVRIGRYIPTGKMHIFQNDFLS
jgi:hypothetical protein